MALRLITYLTRGVFGTDIKIDLFSIGAGSKKALYNIVWIRFRKMAKKEGGGG